MIRITETITLIKEECINCGIVFAIPEDFRQSCLNKGPKKSFYCPNGHEQWFGKSVLQQRIDELKQEKDQLEKSRFSLQNQLLEKKEEVDKLNKSIKRRNRRLKAGICPCCNRTFKQLADHMKTKHPDYSEPLHPVKEIHKKINAK